ncbi:transcription termination/antitermination protein NusG [Candidatus Deianiraea vastatrix]|uniref:Transcription termination/antitermination protein NusG n=1 Tax=Candidatus Deianiraea vastatrix TaxID=2163644 RepID=A0A5B8XE85_9RICK|nr:transcription termination/antitermination NusG family protein [Candidatus Deianiraea vastatrix]QED23286.1 Transcription termination/antitermination factor NusG [Candidatus Deianiraea vastatrix]
MSQDFNWYTICVQPKTEDLVVKKIETILGKSLGEEYQSYVEELFVPKTTSMIIQDGEKKEVQTNAYPGYIFAKLRMSDFLKMMLLGVDGVRNFLVGSDKEPKKISQREYQDIITSVQNISKSESANRIFVIGDKIKVKEGSFQEFDGIVSGVDLENSIAEIKVSVFGKEVDVNIPFSGIVKI